MAARACRPSPRPRSITSPPARIRFPRPARPNSTPRTRSVIPTPAEPVEISRAGTRRTISREWVPEAPVALEFNGLSYAVMMATPRDLEDFALGFALTEGLAKTPGDLSDIHVAEVEQGWIVRAALSGLGIEQLTERVRTRVAESSCGL